jgi:hypothetical protein
MRNDILEQAQEIRTSIDSVTGTMADADAAKNPMLFLPWEADTAYKVDDRRRDDGKVYKCLQAHTSQADWEPPVVPALWVVVNVSSPGTIDDPIPASKGMEYEYGKYYLDPEDGKTYLCKRLNETGTIVLYYLPHELIGQYFEEVT